MLLNFLVLDSIYPLVSCNIQKNSEFFGLAFNFPQSWPPRLSVSFEWLLSNIQDFSGVRVGTRPGTSAFKSLLVFPTLASITGLLLHDSLSSLQHCSPWQWQEASRAGITVTWYSVHFLWNQVTNGRLRKFHGVPSGNGNTSHWKKLRITFGQKRLLNNKTGISNKIKCILVKISETHFPPAKPSWPVRGQKTHVLRCLGVGRKS